MRDVTNASVIRAQYEALLRAILAPAPGAGQPVDSARLVDLDDEHDESANIEQARRSADTRARA